MSPPDILQALLSDVQPQTALTFFALLISLGLLASGSSMFESLYSYFWSSPHDPSYHRSHRKSSTSSAPRTRAQQVAAQRASTGEVVEAEPIRAAHYPGLVNISGTYCFLNSTLQALSSLSYLQPQVESSHIKAEKWDVPTPVIDALRNTLNELNTPHRNHKSLRPVSIIEALSQPDPKGNRSRSRLFSSRDHQDAQELFQLVSSCIQEEAADVDSESLRDPGFAAVDRSSPADNGARKEASKNVFEGLTANRRSCVECGYTEAVMHFGFDNLTLPVPRASSCKLEECLAEYTHIELLTDCVCRKCSMLATLSKLTADAERLTAAAADPEASSHRKKKAREARKMQALVQQALDGNRIEQDIPGLELEKVTSSGSTKQAMIARTPAVLVLHLNRSSYFGYGQAAKNSCLVEFPEILDLTPFTTSGALSTQPSAPISSHTIRIGKLGSTQPPPTPNPILYRLAAVVCHYGTHSFGHYITYRRKPRPTGPSNSISHLSNPRVPHSLTCNCAACVVVGRIRDYEPDPNFVPPAVPNTGWLRISDDSVTEVGLAAVLREASGTFMLYYERVSMDGALGDQPIRKRSSSVSKRVPPPLHLDQLAESKLQPYAEAMNTSATTLLDPHLAAAVGMSSPRSSEETITPENVKSIGSPRSIPDDGIGEEGATTPRLGKSAELSLPPPSDMGSSSIEFPRPSPTPGRIVRNVSIGRSRTTSATSSVSLSLPPMATAKRPLPPLVIETDPSTLPPGSARTRTRFTPPTTPKPPSPMPPHHIKLENGSASPAMTKAQKRKAKKAATETQTPTRMEIGLEV